MMERHLSDDHSGASFADIPTVLGKLTFRGGLKSRILSSAVVCFLFAMAFCSIQANDVLA
jgi:hypothetical protein